MTLRSQPPTTNGFGRTAPLDAAIQRRSGILGGLVATLHSFPGCAASARATTIANTQRAPRPHVLTFEAELVLDGRTFERPVNYAPGADHSASKA